MKKIVLLQVLINKQLREDVARKAQENGLSVSSYIRFVLTNLTKLTKGEKNEE